MQGKFDLKKSSKPWS